MFKMVLVLFTSMLLFSCSKNNEKMSNVSNTPADEITREDNLTVNVVSQFDSNDFTGSQNVSFGIVEYAKNEIHSFVMKVSNKNSLNAYNLKLKIPAEFIPQMTLRNNSGQIIALVADSENPSYFTNSSPIVIAKASGALPRSLTFTLAFNPGISSSVQPAALYEYLIQILGDKVEEENDPVQTVSYNLSYQVAPKQSDLTDYKSPFQAYNDGLLVNLGNYIAVDDLNAKGVVVDATISNQSNYKNGYKIRQDLSSEFVSTLTGDGWTITNPAKCANLAYLFSCKLNLKYTNQSATLGEKIYTFYINDVKIYAKVNVIAPSKKIIFENSKIGSQIYSVDFNNETTIGPFKNTDGVQGFRLFFKNTYLTTDMGAKVFKDLVFENLEEPFVFQGNGCSSLGINSSCFISASFDTTGKNNGTYTSNFTFRSPFYPYEIINGKVNFIIDTPVPQRNCEPQDINDPLSGLVSGNGVRSITGLYGSCKVSFCYSGYNKASDSKSCILNTALACTMTNAFNGNDTGLTDKTGVSSVKGNLGSCLVHSCLGGYTKSADEKLCIPNVAPKCALPSNIAPLSNANGKITGVDTSKDVGQCSITSCESGYSVSVDGLSCQQDVIACDMNNAIGNGLTSISNVLSVKGNTPNCLVDACDSGYSKSGDEKTCIADIVACDMNNAVGNGLTSVSNVLSVKGNAPNCLVDTCASGYVKSGDEKLCELDQGLVSEPKVSIDVLRSSDKCSFSVQTISSTALDNEIVFNSATNPLPNQADQHVGQVRLDSGSTNINVVSNCQPGYSISAIKEYSKPILSVEDGYWSPNNDSGALNADSEHLAVSLNFQLLNNYTIFETARGVTEFQVANTLAGTESVAYTQQARTALSNKIYFSKNSGTFTQGASIFLVIDHSNGNDMVIKLGETYRKNESPNAYEDFGFIPNTARIGADSGLTPPVSCSQALDGQSCSLGLLDSNKIYAFSIQSQSYPITLHAIEESSGDRVDMTSSLIEKRKVMITSGTDAALQSYSLFANAQNFSRNYVDNDFYVSTEFIEEMAYTSDECLNYSGNSGGMPTHPRCASLSLSEVYGLKSINLPSGVEHVGSSNNIEQFRLSSTVSPSLSENIVQLVIGRKNDSIQSDLDMIAIAGYGPEKYIAILPQDEDAIQTTIQFYEKDLDRKISKVSLSIHKNENGSYNDFSSNFEFTCLGSSTTSAANVGTLIDFSLESGKQLASSCFGARGVQAKFVNYPSTDEEQKDLFRTGSYKLIYNVESMAIIGGNERTKVIEQEITISADNEYTPSLTLTNNGNSSYIANHDFLRIEGRPVLQATNGKYYPVGTSQREYDTLTSASTTVPVYRNQDYNFKMKKIDSGTTVKALVDLTAIPEDKKTLAHNAYIRIFDPRNNGSCRQMNIRVGDDLISFINPANRRTVSQLSAGEELNYNTTYIMNALTENMILSNGNTGCTQSAGTSGISSAVSAEPFLLTEKYDFIGNDDAVCEAGEVCYVNSGSSSSPSSLKVGVRSYMVRAMVRSEHNEVNYVDQLVNVEQPLGTVVAENNAVNMTITPKVDSRLGDDVSGFRIGESYVVANRNDSLLNWIDYKTPVGSVAKFEISVSGIDCTSGCEYSFIEYGAEEGDTSYDKKLYTGNTLADMEASQVFSSSNTWIPTTPYLAMADNNIEVLALVKKDNVVYRKLINMAITKTVRSESVMYAIKSEYSGGQFSGFKFIYDLNKYGTNVQGDDIIETDKTPDLLKMSLASYPETIRNAFESGIPVSFTPNGNASIHMTNYHSGGHLFDGFSPASSNLDFYKLGKVIYNNGLPTEDGFHWYFRFKQCPEVSPYYYYNDLSGWSCKSTAQATTDMWVP